MNDQQKIDLYKKAVYAYEVLAKPIMSDAQFDMLELEVKKIDKNIVKQVGSGLPGDQKHPSLLLSLGKIKVWDDDNPPLDEIKKWFSKFPKGTKFECGPKYDGNAMNLIYENGEMIKALTRSDKHTGFDKKHKMQLIAPSKLPTGSGRLIEIRGEVVIPKETFDSKYAENFANERNYVAGVIGADGLRAGQVKELVFMAIEMRIHRSDNTFGYLDDTQEILSKMGFNQKYPVFTMEINGLEDFKKVYDRMKKYREEESPFRLDGFVIKAPENMREDFGFNSHDPNWAIAIKFPPKDAITKILSHDWKTGTTGEVFPTAILEPLELDGTIVTRASIHNWDHIVKNRLFPGAEVVIMKAGDIVPQIYHIVKGSDKVLNRPTNCPSCNSVLEYNSPHLKCVNPDCPSKNVSRLTSGFKILKVKGIGESTVNDLFEAGIIDLKDFWDNDKMNKTNLIASGRFKEGRALDKIFEARDEFNRVRLATAIRSLKLPDVGEMVSEELAKYYSKVKYDFGGLNKDAVNRMTDNTSEDYNTMLSFIKTLASAGVTIIKEKAPVDVNKAFVTFEMTGDPPDKHDLKHKADWAAEFEAHGCKHTSLTKETQYLVTDDYASTTGKMQKAKKYGTKVLTYEDFYDKFVVKK